MEKSAHLTHVKIELNYKNLNKASLASTVSAQRRIDAHQEIDHFKKPHGLVPVALTHLLSLQVNQPNTMLSNIVPITHKNKRT